MVGMLLFAAHSSFAQNVVCTVVQPGQPWPFGTTKYCGTTVFGDGNGVAGTLNSFHLAYNSNNNSAGTQLAAQLAPFYIFGNAAQFTSYCQANPMEFHYQSANSCPGAPNGPPLSPDAAGFTASFPGTPLVPAYSAVFKTAGGNRQPVIDNATAHEIGHWVDSYYTVILGSPNSSRSSSTPNFQMELSEDWINLNNVAVNKPCSAPGNLFTDKVDENNNPICSGGALTGIYMNLSNEQVLQTAQPYYFGNASTDEFWAEQVAVVDGQKDNGAAGIDSYLQTPRFFCTNTLIRSLMQFGQVPGRAGSTYQWPNGYNCPVF